MVGILYHRGARDKRMEARAKAASGKPKSSSQLERIIKGFANHYRLDILFLLQEEPGLTAEEIAVKLSTSYMNTSDHLRKLVLAGLIFKKNEKLTTHHTLTSRALDVLAFCKKLK